MKPLRVYLSSTFEDLKEYRLAVFGALERAGLDVERMEGYTASDERPLDLCLRGVARADIYVGLFAWRYGYIPPAAHGNPEGQSITELEYRHAALTERRKLLFFAHPETIAGWPERFRDEVTGEGNAGARLAAFRNDLGTEKLASFFRTPDELAALVLAAIMRTGMTGRAYNVPPRPTKFVARPTLTGQLIRALVGTSGSGSNTVVLGAPGFGKTSLALDACQHPEVVAGFPGGILWASLGKSPDIPRTLADLHVVATGALPAAAGADAIGQALAQALGRRGYLVVVDDAWRADDVRHFVQLEGARLLVTTRVNNLVAQAGEEPWPEVAVEDMTPAEASALLARGSGFSAPFPAALERLAAQLGCWPLLLELASARILEEHKRGRGDFVACADWIAGLLRTRGVRSLDRRDSSARNAAVTTSVAASLEFAEQTCPGISDKAASLSVFAEDTAIPLTTLTQLWRIDRLALEEDVLRPLDNLSIVKWDRRAEEVQLHDAIRQVLEGSVTKPSSVHGDLVDAWGDLHRLPDEYAWRSVAYHLVSARRAGVLRALLLDYEWMLTKAGTLGMPALVADYEMLPEDRELRLVRRALQLSAHILAGDMRQLASQLHGRLSEQGAPGIRVLLESAARTRGSTWLRPRTPSLAAAGGPLLRTLAGHAEIVLAAAITPDGRRVVSGSADHTLIVWSLATGVAELRLEGHTGSVTRVVVTPDGRFAVSGANDATVRVWDLEEGIAVSTLRGHGGVITALAACPDGRHVVSGSNDGTLKVWDLWSGDEVRYLAAHRDAVNAVKVTNDGRYAVSASSDTTLSVWDWRLGIEYHTLGHRGWNAGAEGIAPDGREGRYFPNDGRVELWDRTARTTIHSFIGHAGVVDSVALTPDGRLAISGSRDQTLRVWDLESGSEVHQLRGHAHQVATVVTTPNGRFAVSSSLDKTPKVWDLESGRAVATMSGHTFDIFAIAVTPDSRRVLSGSSDNTVVVWDLEQGAELRTLREHTGSIRALAVTPDGRSAVSASNDSTLRVWDLDALDEPQHAGTHQAQVNAAAISDNGRVAVTGAGAFTTIERPDYAVKAWDVVTGRERATLQGHRDYVWTVAVTSDGRRAVSGSQDHDLKVWNLETGVELGTLRGHTDRVNAVVFARNGLMAVSGAADGDLIAWDIKSLALAYRMSGHGGSVSKVIVAPDDRTAVSASDDTLLKAWDLDTGREVTTFSGHTTPVFAVRFTPDGTRLVSGGIDGTLRVWDLQAGSELLTLRGHTAVVTDIAVSPDGRWLASASGYGDGSVRVWDPSHGELVRTLRANGEYITSVHFAASSDALSGVRVMCVSSDHAVRLWDVATGTVLATFTGESPFRSSAMTRDGTAIMVGELSGRVHFLGVEGTGRNPNGT
jgi:WD40 repeat protein